MSSVNDWETRALERRCVHCDGESSGTVYSGQDYLRVVQGLRGDEAMTLARLVGPFFWSDADMMHVRLCTDCIARLGIENVATGSTFTSRPELNAGA